MECWTVSTCKARSKCTGSYALFSPAFGASFVRFFFAPLKEPRGWSSPLCEGGGTKPQKKMGLMAIVQTYITGFACTK